MSYTVHSMYGGLFVGALTGNDDFLSRNVTLAKGVRTGLNKVTVYAPQRSGLSTVDGTPLTADEDNVSLPLTSVDKGIRHAKTPSGWETVLQQGIGEYMAAQAAVDADDVKTAAMVALSTALDASTNTQSLATDNTFTATEWRTAVNTMRAYGARRLVFLSGPAGCASLQYALGNLAGGRQDTIGETSMVGLTDDGVEVWSSINTTIATTTGGNAGFLYDPRGVIGTMVPYKDYGPVVNPSTGTVDFGATCAYAFGLLESAGGRLVLQFLNP